MENFVTDFDKLFNDFENSNGNGHVDHNGSSEYNYLKVNLKQNVSNFDIEHQLLSFPNNECSIINEKSSPPKKKEINEVENVSRDEDISGSIITDISNNKAIVSESQVSIESLYNGAYHDKRRTNHGANQDNFDNSIMTLSPSPNQVPRKKSRPNSLIGLPSIISTESSFEENSKVIPKENIFIDTNETLYTGTYETPSNNKRPKSLNIVGKNNDSNTVFRSTLSVGSVICNTESSMLDDKVSSSTIISDIAEADLVPDEVNIWQGIPVDELGKKEPTWISDDMSENCMQCEVLFTMFRRRHHCRACGRLLCNKCCCWRMQLCFSNKLFPKERVCAICFQYLVRVEAARKHGQSIKSSNFQPRNSVLKSNRPMSLPISPNSLSFSQQSLPDNAEATTSLKSVIFADGIRPGGDLTEFETSRIITPTKFQTRSQLNALDMKSQEPVSREPPLFDFKENYEISGLEKLSSSNNENTCIIFPITRNLYIQLQIIKLPYCTCSVKDVAPSNNGLQECNCESIDCWYFASMGLETIGVEEIIIVLKRLQNEFKPPMEILKYYFQIYEKTNKNETKLDNIEMTVEPFSEKSTRFKDWAGILHVRPTFQCFNKIPIPYSSFLIGILIHRWEAPWAMLLPLRLILALGNQSRFYPCSIISDRDRSPVYGEVGPTILQVVSPIFIFPNNLERGICDTAIVPTVPGMWLHLLASQETIVQIPKHSYSILLDILSTRQSQHSPLVLSAAFSREADSHLVCCQNAESGQYYSSAISIQNTERSVTAATLVLFAPCKDNDEHGTTIVEDAIVVKLSQLYLSCIINSLKTMSDLTLQCGSSGEYFPTKESESSPDHRRSIIKIVWTDSSQMCDMASIERSSFVTNETVQSALNWFDENGKKSMRSCRVPSSLQNMSSDLENVKSTDLKLVWTRFHIVESGSTSTDFSYEDPVDVEKIIRDVACFFAALMIPFLKLIHEADLINIGLRIKIERDNVEWMLGASKKYQYCSSPDQSPTSESDSRNYSYCFSKMRHDSKSFFNVIEKLPDVCLDYINKELESFLHSKRILLRNESLISELEFHIIK